MSVRAAKPFNASSSSFSCPSFPSYPSCGGCATSSRRRPRGRRGCDCGSARLPPSSPPQSAAHQPTQTQLATSQDIKARNTELLLIRVDIGGRGAENLPSWDPARRPSLLWLKLLRDPSVWPVGCELSVDLASSLSQPSFMPTADLAPPMTERVIVTSSVAMTTICRDGGTLHWFYTLAVSHRTRTVQWICSQQRIA